MREVSANKKNLWWFWGKRLLTLFFFIMVPVMLFMLVKNLDWQEVKQALQSFSARTLLLCVMITVLSYVLFSSYDVLGRTYTGHKLPARQILPVAFVCYAFNLNVSSWVGSIALRYRLYSRLGLDLATITRVLSFSLVTNWVGYVLIGGIVFSLRLLDLLQISMAALNWSLSSLVVFLLLPDSVTYPTVIGIMLISSIAGVITHIPAGLGVLEAVFIALLQHEVSKGSILAALIGYRAIYLLLPLMVACAVYLILEKRAKALRRHSGMLKPHDQPS